MTDLGLLLSSFQFVS